MTETYDIDGMLQRLEEELIVKNISKRAASVNADLSPGYLHGVLNERKEPTVKKLAHLCKKNGLSLSYILFGLRLSPETEHLMALIEANPEARDNVIALLERG